METSCLPGGGTGGQMILADHCVFEATVRLLEAAGYAVTRLRAVSYTHLTLPTILRV